MTDVTPALLQGRYDVVAVVGRGGEGTLVRAVDRRHGRDVALKVRRVPGDPREAERLLVESRTLLSLRPHPGLPLARDDFFEGDRHVLVMDWVEGIDLWAVLTEHGQPGLPPSTVLRWLAPIAEALTHLHTSDPPVVHGDVKPANVVLTPTGQVVLVDFGASSTRGVRPRGGTRGYRAPEVAAGGLPTRAADVYGLAATAFALLSGAPPTGVPARWEGIDPERAARLEHAIRRGLATDPARRTPTPGELIEELRSGWNTEALPTGVLTFLATDVVSSTRLWQDAPDMAPGLLAEHLLVVDRAVERHRGRRFGNAVEGDATVSVFHRAGDAVRAGVDLQRDLIGGHVQVHCGAHTGEATASDGNYFGATLSRVARIRGLADAGQVLVSATTARLAAGDLPPDVRFVELGAHRLVGFDEPEPLLAVDAEGLDVPPDPNRPPYPGLTPFQPTDQDLFFGREELVEELVARCTAGHVVAVVGGSGSGKSSLVRAGVVPRLAGAQVITPGDHPMAVMGTVGTGPLVVDQLEELVTLCDDEVERTAFADHLVDHPAGCLVTVRADLYGQLANYPRLAAAVAADHVLLGRLSDDDLRRAIERPAEVRGLKLEPGLTEVILADAQAEPGALPLVAHALSETWRRREGRTLTIGGYRDAGGVHGAIAQTAEQLYTGLDDPDRDLLRAVLLRMVEPGEGVADTKRRVVRDELTELAAFGEVDAVLERLASARLVSLESETAEPAHEALLREWPRLRGWIDEDREGLRLLGRLHTSAHDWDRLGRDPGELQRGARLAATLEWVDDTHPALDDTEKAYLEASRAAEEAELTAARDRARRDARSKRRLRILLTAAAVLLVGVVLAGLLAVRQRDRADREASETRARELSGLAQLAIQEDPERAVLLALAAIDKTGQPLTEAVSALQQATQAVRVTTSVDVGAGSLDQRPDGSLVAVDRLDPPGYALIDPNDGRIVAEVTTAAQPGDDPFAFAPDGETLAVAYQGGRDATGGPLDYDGRSAVERFTVPGGRSLSTLDGPPGSYHSLAYDGTGRWLAALRLDPDERPEVVVWDASAQAPPRRLGAGLAFGMLPRTASVVILGPEGRGLVVVDIATGAVIRQIATPEDIQYFGLDVDPTGRLAALSAPTGRTVDVLDLASGALEHRFGLPSPTFPKFSPDGRQLAVRGNDSLIRLFDTETFTETARLPGMPGDSSGLAFSPDGSRFVGAAMGSLRSWDLSPEGPAPLGNFHVSGGFPGRLTVAADGSTAMVSVYTGDQGALHRVDLTSGVDTEVLAGVRVFYGGPVVKPDLSAAAALDRGYNTNLTELASRKVTKLGRCEALRAFDETGRFAAIDGRLLCTDYDLPAPIREPAVSSRVVDLSTGRTVLDLGDAPLPGALFGPPLDDGHPGLFAVLNAVARTVKVYDLSTGAEVGTYVPDGDGAPLNFAVTSDGRRLAVTTTDGKLTVIDLAALARGEDAADAIAWTVTAHGGSVQAVSVSESGWIATGSSAGEYRVWSADGELVAELPVELDDPPSLMFAPGTDTLYYEDRAGVYRRFVVRPAETVRLARSLLTRGFTEDECARYFPDERCPTFGQ